MTYSVDFVLFYVYALLFFAALLIAAVPRLLAALRGEGSSQERKGDATAQTRRSSPTVQAGQGRLPSVGTR